MPKYDHAEIEPRWQARWEREQAFAADDAAPGERVYVLDMFPYPSGDGLHVGHPEGYTATDILSRYLRMTGKNVLHPMGWDAFGLPAENAAIKKGIHPRIVTEANVKNFKRQIQSLGFSYDWSREVNTTDPKYYRWTQWIFLQLYKAGLANEAELPIWWCPKDKTGLANEEVVDGCCERCGTVVEKKKLRQWVLKITKYADRLLEGLDRVDWPESIKALQRNWIGKSEGAEVDFAIEGSTGEKVAILIHGCPSKSDYEDETQRHWWPATAADLKKLGYRIVQPAMPHANAPSYREWADVLDRELADLTIGSSTVAIGHSCGASFLARYLAEKKMSIGSLVLVAPAKISGHAKEPAHDSAMAAMFDFEPRPDIAQRVLILYSRNDDPRHVSSAKYYADLFSAAAMDFPEREHFTAGSGVTDIPEMIDWVKRASSIRVFTTRPDTLFGATYLVLAPEHQLVNTIVTPSQQKAVAKYQKQVASKSDLERTSLEKEKTGVFTGAYAINPATNKKIPIWIADYVLASYGTGAIMAVPAHDERDHEFALKFKLPIVPVIKPPSVIPQPVEPSAGVWGTVAVDLESTCWTGDGTLKNSAQFDGMASAEARQKIVDWLDQAGRAKATVQYKLRDWIFSRQRYWGEPIPLVHCPQDGVVPVPEKDLPVLLPDVEKYQPTGTGESPLAAIDAWVNTTCPQCGGPAKRETNTMPQWAGSCWYYLRYLDPHNDQRLADPAKLKAWLPVDVYVGGAEHAVLHLMYARFWHKVLFDVGALPKEVGDEPFMKLKNQGLILGEDGEKMSKSRGNVINPDEIVAKFGADSLRLFEMFMGPFEDAKPWSTQGLIGVRRFLDKVSITSEKVDGALNNMSQSAHATIKFVTDGIEAYRFNTCISRLMKWQNEWNQSQTISQADFEVFLKLLSPFAPHLAEELWSKLGHTTLIARESWPAHDEKLLQAETINYAIQVNGKLRGTIEMPLDSEQSAVVAAALAVENVKKYAASTPKKIIFVKNRLINFIV